jgi:hypothetical protein
MSFVKNINLIIYRFREKGLEIFLENAPDAEYLSIPQRQTEAQTSMPGMKTDKRFIALDPVEEANAPTEEAFAVEGEWHDIPSLKSMLYEDAVQMKEAVEELENGSFLEFKEAFKRVMPHQYQFLKELKDILMDRNSVKDL